MEEVLIVIFQIVGEAILHIFLWIFSEMGGAVCVAGRHHVRKRKQEKQRQEYRATQPKWTLLRSAESPQEAAKQSEELLRPASGITPTEQSELLRADRTSIDSRNLQECAASEAVEHREC